MLPRANNGVYRQRSLQAVVFVLLLVLPLVGMLWRVVTTGLPFLVAKKQTNRGVSSPILISSSSSSYSNDNATDLGNLKPWMNGQDMKEDAQIQRVKTALVLTGAVGKVYYGQSSNIRGSKDIYRANLPYTPLRITSTGIKKHIVDPNGRDGVDIFVHSWNPDLKDEFERYFDPVVAQFEDNNQYEDHFKKDFIGSDWRQVSWGFSIKRALESVFDYERTAGIQYDRVVLYRPDVVLLKDINLDVIFKEPGSEALVFVNNHHGNGKGDFHFIMSHRNAEKFAHLFDSLQSPSRSAQMHGWIKNYIENDMNASWGLSGIYPGKDEEVYRKIPFCKMKDKCEQLLELGFTVEDFKTVRLTNCVNVTTFSSPRS